MEKIASLIEAFCTFPMVEKAELFRRTIFNYLVGNEDMHLKNFSIITLDGINRMAPVYDFVNSTIVLKNPEEIALPLNGKKRGLTRKTFVTYFGQERLGLEPKIIEETLEHYASILHQWFDWIDRSFLSSSYREKYQQVVQNRAAALDIFDL
jgi:serine/threonine-protein kinase HipA